MKSGSSILSRLLPTEAATVALAAQFAFALHGGLVVTLEGELGAGKTAFVRACLRALGERGAIKSPTYALVETYPFLSFEVHHIDFYRLEHPLGWRGAGIEESFHDRAVVLIEWPSKAAALPVADVALTLTVNEDAQASRVMQIRPNTTAGQAFVAQWLEEAC